MDTFVQVPHAHMRQSPNPRPGPWPASPGLSFQLSIHLFFLANSCQAWKRRELAICDQGGHPFTESLLVREMSLALSALTYFVSQMGQRNPACFFCRAHRTYHEPESSRRRVPSVCVPGSPLRPSFLSPRKVS